MLLRRISEHVKDQNWFAVALDFCIVVVGILIAFQITNWSEARGDRVREKQIIERLHSDFEAHGREVDEKLEFMEPAFNVLEETKQLIFNDPNDGDLQRIQNFFENSSGFPGVTGQSDTYEQLVSNGDMNLLANEALRSELVKHAVFTRAFIEQDKAIREWQRPYITPFIRLRSLIDAMPLDEAFVEAGSRADLIVAVDMYQTVFTQQLELQKEHRKSFTNLTEMLAAEKNK